MVKTANEEILDAVIRHQIFLLRYSGTVRNRIFKLLNDTEEEMARRIRDMLRGTEGLTTPRELQRMQSLLAALDAIRLDSWKDARKFLLDEMTQLSYQEPITMSNVVTTALPVTITTVLPSADFLKAIVTSKPFEGRLLKDWAASMANEDLRRIHAAIQAGMVAGEDHATIARRVVGTGRLMGADGVTEMTRQSVQTIVRTAVQHVANGGRAAFFNENKDIIDEEQFVATLDSRTTPICRALDGKKYPVGKGPQPPIHMNCRSLRIAVIDGTLLGNRPAKPTTEKMLAQEYAEENGLGDVSSRADLPRGTKAGFDEWSRKRMRQLIGPVPATSTYQTWLKGQSAAFQNEVLGETKAKLFRNGDLPLDKFVDLNSGREFTLKELASKHKAAFVAAGLDPSGF